MAFLVQSGRSAWHTHTVSLSSGTSPSTFCIREPPGTSEAGVSIINNFLGVNIGTAQAGGSLVPNVGVSFFVQPDSGCAASGLSVRLISTASIS